MDTDVLVTVEACLARLDADGHGAVVRRRDEAVLAEARALEGRMRRGESVGPLAGLCFTVKDAVRTGVLPATAGSLLLGGRPGRAAPVVARLRRADALLVGVTNCAEFALAPIASNRRYGSTVNPAAPARSPGGSSAGCAAAVAGGLVRLSVGSDYGGSIRFPASCTGIFGFRPARGSVPASGQVPAPPPGTPRARFSTPGLLAADVATLAVALEVLLRRRVEAHRPGRVAWVEGEGTQTVEESVVAAVEDVAARLGARHVGDLGGNPLAGAADTFDRIRATDDLEPIRTIAAGREAELTQRMRAVLADRPAPADPDAEETAIRLRQAASRFFRRCPLLVAPVATCAAPPAGNDTPFPALAASRAVSLLGAAALAVPAGATREGAPIGVQLIGSLPAVLWAAAEMAAR